MAFANLPPFAAWRHIEARDGFEVVFLRVEEDGFRFEGRTVATESGQAWSVDYEIELSPEWLTRRARISSRTVSGRHDVLLERDGESRWLVDGVPAARLHGCLDVDLESSALTNAFPIHRLRLGVGDEADAPAVYIRALDLRVERLEQHYQRMESAGPGHRYAYSCAAFDFAAELVYDESGLVTEYPGLAVRAS